MYDTKIILKISYWIIKLKKGLIEVAVPVVLTLRVNIELSHISVLLNIKIACTRKTYLFLKYWYLKLPIILTAIT